MASGSARGSVLALNAGSSTLKFALFDGDRTMLRGKIDGIGAKAQLTAHDAIGHALADRTLGDADHEKVLHELLDWLETEHEIAAVGHRIVHGGPDFIEPVRIDRQTLEALEALTPLAPLHQPPSLEPVRVLMTARPSLPQVACFDTAFHHAMPAVAQRFALPARYEAAGIRRYGFHGLSYEYIASVLAGSGLAEAKVVVAHLGNGASLCAMRGGRSIDTTMSLTALDGLVMGTRPGALDPGVVLYMLQQEKLDAAQIEHVLYKESGLLGLSGTSSDMRELAKSDDPRAKAAIELFVYRVACETAAMAAAMGGIDALVFTGGIGEHDPVVRAAVTERLGWLNLQTIRVIPTDEELVIARHVLTCISRV